MGVGYSLGRLFRRRRAGGLGGSGVDGGVGKSGGDEFGRGVMPGLRRGGVKSKEEEEEELELDALTAGRWEWVVC